MKNKSKLPEPLYGDTVQPPPPNGLPIVHVRKNLWLSTIEGVLCWWKDNEWVTYDADNFPNELRDNVRIDSKLPYPPIEWQQPSDSADIDYCMSGGKLSPSEISKHIDDAVKGGESLETPPNIEYCAEQVRYVLTNRFVEEARNHIGEIPKEVPELNEIIIALDVIEKYCK